MKKMLPIALIGAVSLMVTGCGKSAVSCDNAEAKELVMEITEPILKQQLFYRLAYKLRAVYPSGSYERFLSEPESVDEKAKLAIEQTNEKYEEMAPKVINIRTKSKDDELQLTECSADIGLANGDGFPIDYTISVTSDNNLYVEVFGLN